MLRGGVLIRTEVAEPHELVGSRGGGPFQTGFDLAAGENFQRVGIQAIKEVLVCGVRLRVGGSRDRIRRELP